MSENCNHDCASCKDKCEEKKLLVSPKPSTKIKKMIAVVSGKGGVGKTLVTSLLAVNSNRAGFKTAVLDADVTGPSVPKAFGLTEKAGGSADGSILPITTAQGIKVMSINLLLEDSGEPVIWRGPIISGVVKQFYTDVLWQDVDYMYVDMPPGTGDVPLTVFQSLPVNGIVIVTTPQDLVGMIVEKAVRMAAMMKIPIFGIVENMSYLTCPHCGEKIYLYGKSGINAVAEKYSLPVLGELPVDSKLTELMDKGEIENYEGNYLSEALAVFKK